MKQEGPTLDLVKPSTKRPIPSSLIQLNAFEPRAARELEIVRIKHLDAFYVDEVFSEEECQSLLHQTEAISSNTNIYHEGYSFWHEDDSKRAFRNADTIEVFHEELAEILWKRLEPIFPKKSLKIDEENELERWQPDLEGTWHAIGTNKRVLFAKYNVGGHFAPHTDGFDIVDFDHRSMYSIVVFLNTCAKGGGTRFYNERQKTDLVVDGSGRFTGKEEHIEFTVESKVGRVVIFYHNIMHEGVNIEKGVKYIIRSDIMYKREDPVLKEEKDREAFTIYNQALEMSEAGELEEATKLFKRCFKMSPLLADIYGM